MGAQKDKVMKFKLKTIFFLYLTLVLFLLACNKNKEYILVIDTSGSMSTLMDSEGNKVQSKQDGKSTLDRIKEDSREFVSKLQKGDNLQILAFDSKPEALANVVINSDEDRAQVINTIDNLKASGRYTDMQLMIQKLREIGKTKTSNKKKIIVILSDGKDDPPPTSRTQTLSLDLIQNNDPDSDEVLNRSRYFIYYVSLGKIKDPLLTKHLDLLTENKVKTIKKSSAKGQSKKSESISEPDTILIGSDNPLNVVSEDVKTDELAQQLRFWGLIVLAILSALFLFLLLYWLFYKIMNRNRPQGAFVYYDKNTGKYASEKKSLEKIETSVFTLGSKSGVDLKIRDLGVKKLQLKAIKKSGKPMLIVKKKNDEELFQFRVQAIPGFISQGDEFKLGNFIIEYIDGKK